MRNYRSYTDDAFIDAVKNSLSIAQVLKKLDLIPRGGNYKTFNSKVKELNVDVSHFTGQGCNVGVNYKPVFEARPIAEILVENSTYNTNCLRKRLIKENIKEHKCESCNLKEWMSVLIPLELDHINGVNTDNRLENLRLLCPNCHALTSTYRGRGRKKETISKKRITIHKYCIDCSTEIHKRSTRCKACSNASDRKIVQNRKVERPTKEILDLEIKNTSFEAVGRKYGVSGNAIRKWVRWYNKNGERGGS